MRFGDNVTTNGWLWIYSLPVGGLHLTIPRQPFSDAELDDMEEFLKLVMKNLRKTANEKTSEDQS